MRVDSETVDLEGLVPFHLLPFPLHIRLNRWRYELLPFSHSHVKLKKPQYMHTSLGTCTLPTFSH